MTVSGERVTLPCCSWTRAKSSVRGPLSPRAFPPANSVAQPTLGASAALRPCPRCCEPLGKPNVVLGTSSESPEPLAGGEELVFVFDNCRSYCVARTPFSALLPGPSVGFSARCGIDTRAPRRFCNSSRLHLGGHVVLGLEIADNAGTVVAQVHSQPFLLCSKSSLHAARTRSAASALQQRPKASLQLLTLAAEPREPPQAAETSQLERLTQSDNSSVAARAPPAGGIAPAEPSAAQGIPDEAPGFAGTEDELSRQMDELERMKQQNMSRVLLLRHLISITSMAVQPPGSP